MSGPFGEISLVPRFNLEVESISPVQDLILGFYLVISVAFHLETLAVYQVAASLLLLEWQVKKFSRNTLHASSSSAISALRVGLIVGNSETYRASGKVLGICKYSSQGPRTLAYVLRVPLPDFFK